MEQQCNYCKQPLYETEQVRWYSEYVHCQCYDTLLTDPVTIMLIELPTHVHSDEMTAEFADAVAAH
jgi:hypothetical protein